MSRRETQTLDLTIEMPVSRRATSPSPDPSALHDANNSPNPKQKRFLPKAPSVNYGKVGAGMVQYRAAQAQKMLKRTSSTPGRTSSQTGEHIRAALGADRENRNVRHIMDEPQDDGGEERLNTDELRKKLVTVMHSPAPTRLQALVQLSPGSKMTVPC